MKRILLALIVAPLLMAAAVTPTTRTTDLYKGTSKQASFTTATQVEDCNTALRAKLVYGGYECRTRAMFNVTADSAPLALPTDVIPTAVVTGANVVLTWPASPVAEKVDEYQVYLDSKVVDLHVKALTFTLLNIVPGVHTVAVSAHNATGYGPQAPMTQAQVTIAGVPPPPPPTGTPSTADFIHADQPFASMQGTVQLLGGYPSLSSVGESTGVSGSGAVLGSPMRFGKVADPLNPSRKVFRFGMRISDPQTAGGVIRVDVIHGNNSVAVGTTYWAVDEMLIPSNVYYANDVHQLAAVHPPDGSGSMASAGNLQINKGTPTMTVIRGGNGQFVAYVAAQADFPPDTWLKIVHQFRVSPNSDGFHKIWCNGKLIFSDTGSNGTGQAGHYWKGSAFYQVPGPSWTDASRPEQAIYRRSMSRPFPDAGQSEPQMRALLQ